MTEIQGNLNHINVIFVLYGSSSFLKMAENVVTRLKTAFMFKNYIVKYNVLTL